MEGENNLFKLNVAYYLVTHSIIVPLDLDRNLTSGHVYNFDLQAMPKSSHVKVQGNASLVILTLMADRGKSTGHQRRCI
jgi:hypothetical protein